MFAFMFKKKSKMDIIQNLIIHNVIDRRKIALDQLANGLEILGFRDDMKQHIDHVEELFVVKEKLTATNVLNTLGFQDKLNADEEKTKQFLLGYLENSSDEQLKIFLVLSTGAPVILVFRTGKIEINFDTTTSIFAWTCLKSVTIPKDFPDKEKFEYCFEAVLTNAAKKFNCI